MDKVLCPYCGAEMIPQRESTGMTRGIDFMQCGKCAARSPEIRTLNGAWDGKQDAALAVAMQRYVEPEEIAALRAENAAFKSDIEEGRMVRLPAAVGQMVYVPSGDGGVYGAYVKDIGVLRPDAHDAIMRATVRVGLESKTLEYMIALENKGTHWFDTEEAARAALEGGQHGTDQPGVSA